jgi:imidazole glycerol phosphate synthase subunit HisF
MPTDVRHATDAVPLTTSKLVMVSVPPGARREVTVSVDGSGRAVGYNDLVFTSTSLRSGKGDNVVAMIDREGRVRGWHLRTNTQLPDSIPLGASASDQRSMRAHMVTTSSRDTLSAEAQRKVLELAAWLRRRCPA